MLALRVRVSLRRPRSERCLALRDSRRRPMLTLPNAPLIAQRYRALECVGRGGMGTVYRGIDNLTGVPVAIKHLRSDLGQLDPTSAERFRREGESLVRLEHPNVVQIFELVREGADEYIVMEFVPGGSLAELLERQAAPLAVEHVVRIGLDLCDALSRCHALGIVHRDIKPSNILLTEQGAPKLSDFGVAYVEKQERLTQSSTLVGTAEYLSPEALRGDEVDARADVWAFGVLLFEMLTLQRPFAAPNVAQTLHSITFAAPPDLEALRPDCPLALVELVYVMLAKDRAQRVPNVRTVSAALEQIARGDSGDAAQAHARARALREAAGSPSSAAAEAAASAPAIRNNVPAVASTLVGRQSELAALSAVLAESSTRLLSITAPGGMGKTRLALELAQKLLISAQRTSPQSDSAWFRDGVFWIQLTALASIESILPAIAEVLGVNDWPGQRLEERLTAYLRDKHVLLVLDNFEHLLEGAHLLAALLAAAPDVRMLVTSRERLGLSSESVFPLGGLDFPEATPRGQPADFSAVRLFVQCARQQRPGFALDAESAREAARICRLLEGSPLGIVLSASWAGTLSPREIAEELDDGLDFLATEWSDVPERQRSMRAVFEQSWSRLSEPERDVLSALSVFRGGFTRDAGQSVAGATLRALSSLIDKCLLRRVPSSGRFETHELLRQYAERKLAEDPTREAHCRERHAAFFTRFLESREAELRGPSPAKALSELEAEFDNVRAAWNYLLEARRTLEVTRSIEPLNVFHTRRASFSEADATFAALAKSLERGDWPEPCEASKLLAYTLSLRAMYLRAQGRYALASELLDRAEQRLEPQRASRETAFLLATRGSTLAMVGELERGTELTEQAVRLYRSSDDAWGLSSALESLGRLRANAGDLVRAAEAYRESTLVQRRSGLLESGLMGLATALVQQGSYAEGSAAMLQALATFENAGDRWNAMRCRMHLANTRRNLGEYVEAEALARQCLEFCIEVGNRDHEVWAHFQLGNIMKEQQRYAEAEEQFSIAHEQSSQAGEVGKVALAQLEFGDLAAIRGDYASALAFLEESYAGFERAGQGWGTALSLDVRAFVLCKQGDTAEARQLFERALEIAMKSKLYPFACNTVAGLAWVHAALDDSERAAELLGLVRSHSATERHTLTRRVEPLLERLREGSHAAALEAALARGAQKSLDALLAS